MTMHSDTYYIMNENINGLYDCIQSYKNIEMAKQQAKMISEQLNMTTLIVKPVVKVIPIINGHLKDLN